MQELNTMSYYYFIKEQVKERVKAMEIQREMKAYVKHCPECCIV